MTEEINLESLPNDIEAEKAVLGAILIDPDALPKIINILKSKDFYRNSHQTIYNEILYLNENEIPIDYVTFKDHLRSKNLIENVGGMSYIINISEATPNSSNVVSYAEIVIKKSILRKNAELGNALYKESVAENEPAIEIIKSKLDLLNNQTIEPVKQEKKGVTFPYEIMEGLAGDFASIYSDCLEGAKEFFYISCLTCMGSLFSNQVTLESELHTEPRLYTLLIGESSDARKSTILSKTSDFFKEAIYDYRTHWGAGSAEGLCRIVEEKKPLLILYDEFKSFISKCKIENSVLLPMMTTLFESNIYQNVTKREKISLENAHLSILGASTINTYEKMWTANFMEIGFLNRIFIVPGDSQKKHSIPKEIDCREKTILKEGLRNILSFVEQARGNCIKLFLPIDEDAKALYHKWYMTLPKTEYAKRLDTYAVRFMILLAINVQKTRIDKDIVEKVIGLMNWQYEVRKAYDPIDAENSMARMEQSIRNKLAQKGALRDRELKQRVHAYRAGLWIYNTAIKNLQEAREIQMKNKEWFLNEQKV